ncbi:variant erythrocyte surface antigen-1 family protein [Babesia caballi]|uniref:Variant erythrocyte surface antigen-1 family protein n=1 Tax=Babesia caballi TaxID=5871 RepID=A0AAV4LSK4_BABCB|nr:variant erythrocyte surface antigen-1 family protein [Babesia caballi]
MSGSGGKSLPDAPENLKEAIDWVIKIKKHDVINDLAKELDAVLKNDGSEVAMKVLDKYRLVSESVIEGLVDANLKIQAPKNRFHFTYTALNNLSEGLRPFHPQSQANISANAVENVKEWVSSIKENTLKTPITELATGLENLKNGILQNSNDSAYNSASSWKSLTPSDKNDCAAILLGIVPVVYIAITHLYWQCEGTGGWDNQDLAASSGDHGSLKQYMAALGYTANPNNKTGGEIVTCLAGFNELSSGNAKSNYPDFLKALQDEALKSTSLTSPPLTSLYLISYYYITYPLYNVQSTSPATPSFLGYSGTAAMAGGAYGFNLGGLGTFMSALLAWHCNVVIT